jgi:predicted transglutaminase-like protease
VFIFNNYKSSEVIQFILLLYYVRCYAQDYSTALLHGINQPAIQLTKILNSHLKIWIVTYATKRDTPPCVNNTGIDPA